MEEFFVWIATMIITMVMEVAIVAGIFLILAAPFYLPGFCWRTFQKIRGRIS